MNPWRNKPHPAEDAHENANRWPSVCCDHAVCSTIIWDRLIAAAKVVPIVAIVNPTSGPGDHVDPYRAKVMARARKGNVKLVAHIGTQYTRKPLEAGKREVDTYLKE